MTEPRQIVITNARVWTGVAAPPGINTVLIREGRIAFAGRADDVTVPPDAHRIDVEGRLIVPGFIDAHAHLLATGAAMSAVPLKAVPTVEEAARRVAERAGQTPAGAWIRGAGWDQNDWPGERFPHRSDLDAVAPEHPVILTHTSGHCIWVNTAALRTAGISASTTAPVGGAIDIDATGEPTGILRDMAAALVTSAMPAATPPERRAALEAAIAHAHSLGVTGAHAMDVGRGEYQALLSLRDSNRLRFRARAYLSASRLDEWIERAVKTGDGDDVMRIGGVKFFADGALGSLTAWMFDPYDDAPGTGFPLQPVEQLERDVRRCLESGLAPAIHAIGDRANREVLDIYGRLRDVAPILTRRIEHAQLLSPDELPRFAQTGVIASMQPIHATQDMEKVERSWGARGASAYAFASMLRSGARLAFGSDTPVETMDPIAGLHAAVTRRNSSGEPSEGWYPDERISLESALQAYTAGSAEAAGDTGTLGVIREGAHADLAVLSHDLLALEDPMRILGVVADVTIVGGEVVYERAAP